MGVTHRVHNFQHNPKQAHPLDSISLDSNPLLPPLRLAQRASWGVTQNDQPPSLSLRPLQLSDASRLLEWMTDQQCADLAIEPLRSLAQAERLVTGQGYSHKHRYGIFLQQNHVKDDLIGGCAWGLHSDGEAYLSYWVFPAYQRKGLGKKAISILLAKIKHQGIKRVSAEVFDHNYASIALLKRLGFVRQGELRHENKPVLCFMVRI